MKKSTKIWIGVGVIVLFYVWIFNSSSNDNEKRKNEEVKERQRVESVIAEVNSLTSKKDFDNALVKANIITWNLDPSYYQSNVEHYEKQKKEIIETITQLKANSDSLFAVQSAQNARQEQSHQDLTLLKQQKKILTKQFQDSLNKINSK